MILYGATGVTGSRVARVACARGLRPLLAGRSAEKLAPLAEELGLPYRVVRLDDAAGLARLLQESTLLINAAGPFEDTTRPLLRACLEAARHYLDLSGEVDSLELVSRHDAEARARRVMVMPGVGFDVVASDCLALHLLERVRRPRRLRVGLTHLGNPSSGSRATMMRIATRPVRLRRGGQLQALHPGSLFHRFPFAAGKNTAVAVSWGDVVTAHYTLGVPDVETYFELTPRVRAVVAFQRGWQLALQPSAWRLENLRPLPPAYGSFAEPSAPEIVCELSDAAGHTHAARLRTGDVYDVSAAIAVEVARRVAQGDLEPGFQTAARIYGADFIMSFEGVRRTDLT